MPLPTGSLLSGGRRDGDDAPPPGSHHVGKRSAHTQECSGQIYGYVALPFIETDLVETSEPGDRCAGDQYVDRAQQFAYRSKSRVDRILVGHIDLDGHRLTAAFVNVCRTLGCGLAIDVQDRDTMAILGQLGADRFT